MEPSVMMEMFCIGTVLSRGVATSTMCLLSTWNVVVQLRNWILNFVKFKYNHMWLVANSHSTGQQGFSKINFKCG